MQEGDDINKSSSEKEIKQCYLRQEIIDRGYEPEEFVKFLNSKLDIDSDIERCSLEQLETVVTQFKAIKNEEAHEIQSYHKQVNKVEQPLCERISSIQESFKVVLRSEPLVQEEEFLNNVKCVKVNSKTDKSNIVCEVNNPERKQIGGVLGIGSTSFLCFSVWSYGLRKQPVYRRYSDFVWLRAILSKFHPSEILPPIPNKKASKRLPRQIQKRMRILTFFLNDLVKNPIMFNNRYVQAFLTIEDNNKFQKIKEEAENVKAYESIYSTETMSGTVWLQLTDKTVNYKHGLMKFIPQAEKLYKQITRNSKKMKAMTFEKINLLYDMGNQFAELHDISSKFHSFVKTESTQKLSQIYCVLNNLMAEWGNSLKDEIEEVQKNLSTFFKYVREDFMGFYEVINREEEALTDFLKQKQTLDRQKDKIFQLQDTKKWEVSKSELSNIPKSAVYDKKEAFKIMLPKQSVKVEQAKQKLGYFLAQLNRNGETHIMRTIDNYCENFKQFSIKMKVVYQKLETMWSQVSIKFSDPFKKHQTIQRMQTIIEEPDMENSHISKR